MLKNKLVFFSTTILLAAFSFASQAQELNAKVTIVSNRIGTQIDKSVFTTLENQLTQLLNNRKWTTNNFKSNEKIECTFLLNLNSQTDNIYSASLTVQAARPIFNSTYNSPLINFQDNDVSFKYIAYQQVDFNENRVSGTDALASNLTAIFGYYVNLILAMDYESFALGTGEPYFKKMLNIVNNAPDGSDIKGWTQFDGIRNRYWLSENVLNSRYSAIHEIIYKYYRSAMDIVYDDEAKARDEMLSVLNALSQFVAENSNTMIIQFFMQGKSDELINIFKKGTPDQRSRVVEILQKVDVIDASKYKDALK